MIPTGVRLFEVPLTLFRRLPCLPTEPFFFNYNPNQTSDNGWRLVFGDGRGATI